MKSKTFFSFFLQRNELDRLLGNVSFRVNLVVFVVFAITGCFVFSKLYSRILKVNSKLKPFIAILLKSFQPIQPKEIETVDDLIAKNFTFYSRIQDLLINRKNGRFEARFCYDECSNCSF
jgi:ABC-type enterochelin transport system permease subunit